MKILNKTHFQTRDLKKILTAALTRNEKIEGKLSPNKRKNLFIKIVYSRGLYSGYATLGGSVMVLRVPKHHYCSSTFAWLFIHELYHIRGFEHKQMGSFNNYNRKDFLWAKEYTINKVELNKKSKGENLQEKRYEHVLNMLDDKKKKMKRLENQIKKWESKKKYYEKVLNEKES